MAPMTAAERQRRYREKLKVENPDKLDRIKKENALTTNKKYKKINDLNETLQNKQRKKWRDIKNKRKDKQINIENAETRKDRYILSKKTNILSERINKMTRIIRSQKKTIYRYKKKLDFLTQSLHDFQNKLEDNQNQEPVTPISKTEKFINLNLPNVATPDKEKVKKAIFEGNVLKESLSNHYSKAESQIEKDIIKSLVDNDITKKYKLKTELGLSLGLKGRIRRKDRAQVKKIKTMSDIKVFLERDDNSRATAGKKETKTHRKDKRQIRYLQDSLEKLHKKYKEEGGLVSYTTFTRYRPFHILDPKINQRNTCACVKHANLSFLAAKLKILGVLDTTDLEDLVSTIVCDRFNEKCMYNQCNQCRNKSISLDLTNKKLDGKVSWNAWVTKKHEYEKITNEVEEKKVTKRIVKDTVEGSLQSLIESFSEQLFKFKTHFYNIYHAAKSYKTCKETLAKTECVIHCDFSENYTCKSSEEVQATHFGASKIQFTLHTGVIYYKDSLGLQEKSFCTISPNNTHNPIAIWAHLRPILQFIRNKLPHVTTLHFFSDGPTTQYRQKGNFYIMSLMTRKLGFGNSTWSFFESAHGKGAADGIGGAVKRRLDSKVTYGYDIIDAQAAYNILNGCQSKIIYFYITDEDIKAVEQDINLTGLIPVPQTMTIHQILTTANPNIIKFRKLACFCRRLSCQCFELQEHNLKLKTQKRKRAERKIETNKKIIQRRRKESRKASMADSDTSVESNITYAETDESDWQCNDEYNSDHKIYGSDEDGINSTEVVATNDMKALDTIKCTNKKITVLAEIKNTPDNYKYFDLRNYGPFNLTRVNKFEIHKASTFSNFNDGPSTSGIRVEQRNKREEIEENKKICLNERIRKDVVETEEDNTIAKEKDKDSSQFKFIRCDGVKEAKGVGKRNSVLEENKNKTANIDEYLKHNTNEDDETELDVMNDAKTSNETKRLLKMQAETEDVIYNINDSVLVRYYKQRWVYYIGFIERLELKSQLIHYTIRFLKTVKKPCLHFVTTKKIDIDTVPKECLVKKIHLNSLPNSFTLQEDCNSIYFI